MVVERRQAEVGVAVVVCRREGNVSTGNDEKGRGRKRTLEPLAAVLAPTLLALNRRRRLLLRHRSVVVVVLACRLRWFLSTAGEH